MSSLRRFRGHPRLRCFFLLAAAACLSACSTPIPPAPDLQVTAKPMPLAGQPENRVKTYLEQFPSFRSHGFGGTRTLSAQDRGKALTAEVADGRCRSLRISGRLGDSLFPHSPGDLAELRDAYSGQAAWQVVRSPAGPLNALSGRYDWVSATPPLQASATWTYESAAREAARYEVTILAP